MLINSPHNPTGRVYPAESLAALGDLLRRKSAELGRIIYLVSDEPYRRIVYDGIKVPPVMAAYENTIIASSYSKELSLSGERIGYAAANPAIPDIDALMEGLILANRILGFVNAPALMQRAVARLQGVSVDVAPYQRNRDVLCAGAHRGRLRGVQAAGRLLPVPEGAHRGRRGLLPGDAAASGAGGAGQRLRPGRALPHGLLRGAPGGRRGAAGLPAGGGQVLRQIRSRIGPAGAVGAAAAARSPRGRRSL